VRRAARFQTVDHTRQTLSRANTVLSGHAQDITTADKAEVDCQARPGSGALAGQVSGGCARRDKTN
jgi:hypothetical protein